MENTQKIEIEILELIGRFYKERNIDLIHPYLHKNIIYASVWVDETLIGTSKFLKYFESKFQAQTASNWKIDYEVQSHFFNKSYFLILTQNKENDKDNLVKVEFKQSQIYYIHLYPIKEIEFTFYKPPYEWTIQFKNTLKV